MKREEIMETIKSLAGSQGFYGRLYRDLMELDEDEYDEVMTELESQNFKDGVDLVMFIESQEEKIMTLNKEYITQLHDEIGADTREELAQRTLQIILRQL